MREAEFQSACPRAVAPPGIHTARVRPEGDSELWVLCESDSNLRTPPEPGAPGNCPPGGNLDLHIGWDRFEKLLLDVARRVLGLQGAKFRRYGTPGQKQHGIDLAGRMPNGTYVVIQCKDYQTFTQAELRAAVTTFVSGRRPFGAKHFIVATSASTEPTQFSDELAALEDENPGLTIELWGAEQINDHLRSFADVVARFWTRETAATFCTGAPLPGVPAPLPDRRLQAERVLVGPLETEGLPAVLRDAAERQVAQPREAAGLYGEMADRLEVAGFRGHGAFLRGRQIGALRAAGDTDQAIWLTADLIVRAIHRGDREEARRLRYQIGEIRGPEEKIQTTATRQLAVLVTEAVDYLGDPLGDHDRLAAALQEPGVELLPHHSPMVLLLAENLTAHCPEAFAVIENLLRSTIERLSTARWEELGIRLRLVLAEYDPDERCTINAAARQYRVQGRLASLIHAREARRCALESRSEEAVESWRAAVHAGLHEGLVDDAADWLYAVREVNSKFGPWTTNIDDEHHLAQALRGTGTSRLLERARRPSEQARAAALGGQNRTAVLTARQWLTDAVTTGSWAAEMEAARSLGNFYRDNAEPERAAELFARSGNTTKIVELAEHVGDRFIAVRLDQQEPWWVTKARIALLVAQSDLLPDGDAARLLDELIDMTMRGRSEN